MTSWSVAGVVGLAFALDCALGEPPTRLHPVAWFGRLVAPLDRAWSHPHAVGFCGGVFLPLAAGGSVFVALLLVSRSWPLVGTVLAGTTLFLASSFRRLLTTAVSVSTEPDLATARTALRALAGRDAAALSAGQVRSAAVESAAENLADGLVAPLCAVGAGAGSLLVVGVDPPLALSAGVALAVWVKAVNTMDSMLGYRSKPVGWAPARLDDLVMWLPARASAVLLAVAAGSPSSLGQAARWVPSVPSPNSGWPMGVLAGALAVRLEKPGVYVLNPGAELPSVARARRGVRVVGIAGLLAYVGVVALLLVPAVVL